MTVDNAIIMALLVAVSQPERLSAAEEPKSPLKRVDDAGIVFGPTRIWPIHLEISANEFDAKQPAVGGPGFPGGPPSQREKQDSDQKRDSEKNFFGKQPIE